MSELLAELHRRQERWRWWPRLGWWLILMPLAVAAFSAARLHGRAQTGGYIVASTLAAIIAFAGLPQPEPDPVRSAPPPAITSSTSASTTPSPGTETAETPTPSVTAAGGSQTTTAPKEETRTVVRVIDGDTLELDGGERVRLIGIDTPETVHPSKRVECFGMAASARLNDLLAPGTHVRVETDVERTDRYGRTLAYVYTASDHLFVNEAMVNDGFAVTATYPPNVRHTERFLTAERQARDASRGLWGSCQADDGPPPTQPLARPSPAPRDGSCDTAYPDVCIPPAPPDLDCGAIAHRRFRVLAPDPHGFDGNHDGVGCESG